MPEPYANNNNKNNDSTFWENALLIFLVPMNKYI